MFNLSSSIYHKQKKIHTFDVIIFILDVRHILQTHPYITRQKDFMQDFSLLKGVFLIC